MVKLAESEDCRGNTRLCRWLVLTCSAAVISANMAPLVSLISPTGTWPMTWRRTTRPLNKTFSTSSMGRATPSAPCSTNCASSSFGPWAGGSGCPGRSVKRCVGLGGAWGAEGQAGQTERGMGLNVGGGIRGIENLEAEQGGNRESLGWGQGLLRELLLSLQIQAYNPDLWVWARDRTNLT